MKRSQEQVVKRVVNRVLKEANITPKIAKIFDVGDLVTLVDQVQGLNKGVIYKVMKNDVPGKITIAEAIGYKESQPSEQTTELGPEIGEFDADRFVRFNHEI